MAQLALPNGAVLEKSSSRSAARLAHYHVLKALILRDIRTRFFGHGLGYLVAIAWPVVHIAILLGMYAGVGRIAPYGSSTALWFATALVPVMAFIYASRWIMLSVILNQPLLGLPVVKVTDIIVARSILEAAAACCMAAVILASLWLLNISIMPRDVVGASQAMAGAILLGVGVGSFNALIARIAPMWATGYSLLTIVFYIGSGVLFVPDSLPEIARQILSWNPVLHGAEWMRVAYYDAYTSRTLDKTYFIGSGVVWLFLGLACERLIRGRLLQG